jgi:hypothetical protein
MATNEKEIVETLKAIRAELAAIREALWEIARQCRR